MGIMAAIGADSSDIVVVMVLMMRARRLTLTGEPANITFADSLILTSFTYVLTTVLINTLVLGITMMALSRKKPFKLPRELSFTESNIVLGMAIMSFVLLSFAISHSAVGIEEFDRIFQGVIGFALLFFYAIFIIHLRHEAKEKTKTSLGHQTVITEYYPEDGLNNSKPKKEKPPENQLIIGLGLVIRSIIKSFKKEEDVDDESDQFIALRRFPWYIVLVIFLIGITGIIFGGDMLSTAIEKSIDAYDIPILVYCVVVGFVASAPEMTITLRAILNPEKEDTEIGLVHQVSSIDQTFFLLFGLPFLFASLINVNIPVAFDTTLVFSGIFAISFALHLMIIDDGKFDWLEGVLILVASITSLLALAVVGELL
jgi:hypothetical protein